MASSQLQSYFFQNKASRAQQFYGLMLMIGLGTSLVFGLVFYLFMPEVLDPLWMRASIVLTCGAGVLISRKKHLPGEFLKNVTYAMFYLYTAQVLFSAWLNNFSSTTCFIFFLAFSTMLVSTQSIRRAGYFMGAATAGLVLALIFTETEKDTRIMMAMAFVMTCLGGLSIIAIRNKSYRSFRQKEKLLFSLISSSDEALLVMDHEGTVVSGTEVIEQLLGIQLIELLNTPFNKLRSKSISSKDQADGKKLVDSGMFWTEYIYLKNNFFQEVFCVVSQNRVRLNGRYYIFARIRDISEAPAFSKPVREMVK